MNHRQKFKVLALASVIMLTSACSHTQQLPAPDPAPHDVAVTQEKTIKSLPKIQITEDSVEEHLPHLVDYNNYMKKNGAQLKQRAYKSYKAGSQYKSYIEEVAERNKLPDEIYALAAIESGYNPKARSQANSASGMWQLMKPLGRDMGLKINAKVDERMDWKKSTNAALKHLGQSQKRYKDDKLAVLAYYSGVGTVDKAIKKHNTKDVMVLLQDKTFFSKGHREFMYNYIAYEKEYKKLNEKYERVATK